MSACMFCVCGHSPGGVLLDHFDALETLKDLAGDRSRAATEVAGTRSVALAACDIATPNHVSNIQQYNQQIHFNFQTSIMIRLLPIQ